MLSERFIDNLSTSTFLLDGAVDFLDRLIKNNYNISAITNGIKRNQLSRLQLSGLNKYFEHVIISEEVGFAKPLREYFDYAKSKIGFVNDNTLIVGDNIETDIRLGFNNEVDTCWFNTAEKKNLSDAIPTYIVKSFQELNQLLNLD